MRLTPNAFWTMSLVEWRAMISGHTRPRAAPLARAELTALMERYPDG